MHWASFFGPLFGSFSERLSAAAELRTGGVSIDRIAFDPYQPGPNTKIIGLARVSQELFGKARGQEPIRHLVYFRPVCRSMASRTARSSSSLVRRVAST
jgi:hypothetical protein